MAEAIRRLLGLVPVLLVGSILLFALLGKHPNVERAGQLPLFLQRRPVSASSAALAAMHGVARGDEHAAKRLQELGGAALPHILPRLAELDVAERLKVAEALAPLGQRLELDGYRSSSMLEGALEPAHSDANQRLLAWERFYEDHDLDFRPLSVERLVKRLSSRRSGTRQDDLRAVDTYALPYLVRALGRVESPVDVQRIERLAPAIAQLSGIPYPVAQASDLRSARALASQIRKDFDRTGAKFTDIGRLEALTAHLTQTEFGVWWIQMFRELRGIDAPVVLSGLARALSSSAYRLLFAFVGALLFGPAVAGFVQLARLARTGAADAKRTRLFFGLACAVCLPLFCLAGPESSELSILLLLLVSTLASASTLWSQLSDGLDWRARVVLGRRSLGGRWRVIGATLARALPTLLPLMAGEVFLWVACLELSTGQDGLFPRALWALQGGDLHALLALSLLSWTCIALVQTLSDALLPSEDRGWTSW